MFIKKIPQVLLFCQLSKMFSDMAIAVVLLGNRESSHRHPCVSEVWRGKYFFNTSRQQPVFLKDTQRSSPREKQLFAIMAWPPKALTNCESFFKQQVIFIYKLGRGLQYIEQKGNKTQEFFPWQQ